MKTKHRQVRFPESLDGRVALQMERDKQSFSETVRSLVEKGLVYGDLQSYDLSKSVSRFAGSLDDMREQMEIMDGELINIAQSMAETAQVLKDLTAQVQSADARYPTILRTLGEVTLLCRLLARDKGEAAIRDVGVSIQKQFEILSQRVAEEVERRASELAPSRRA